MINIQEAKRGQYCQVRLKVEDVMDCGLVLRVPAGPRVLLRPEYLEQATLVDAPAPARKRTARKAAAVKPEQEIMEDN